MFEILTSGLPQGSVLGIILLIVFLSNLFLWLIKSNVNNFANGNTISVTSEG